MADDLNSLAADLLRASGSVGARAAVVIHKTATDIQTSAQAFAPVDTGNLKGSITVDVEGDGRMSDMAAEIGPTAEYGAYVEYGTARQGPAAYMGPAFDRHGWQFEKAMEQIAGDVL